MLPDQPSHFPPRRDSEEPWRWALLDAAGSPVEVTEEYAGHRFASQADAESWVGEIWSELAAQGVDAVTLLEGDRTDYGPMSLHA